MSDHRALGDFNEKDLVGWFDPRIADVAPGEGTKFGLGLQVQYFYGGLRDDEGNLYVLERKFIGPMTSGLWLMTNRDAAHLRSSPPRRCAPPGARSAATSRPRATATPTR